MQLMNMSQILIKLSTNALKIKKQQTNTKKKD